MYCFLHQHVYNTIIIQRGVIYFSCDGDLHDEETEPKCMLLHEQEIDFVMSDLSLEIIGDFAIVWLLSPKKTFTAAPTSALGLAISKLPGHALQV